MEMNAIRQQVAVDFGQPSFWFAATAIIFNPVFWNIVARLEHTHRPLTRLFGSAYRGCYVLAVVIFVLGLVRDQVYLAALEAQPTSDLLRQNYIVHYVVAPALLIVGNTLVLSSMWALGVTGTYLGDYFGILMDEMVHGFPFNVCASPMYIGSSLSFVGTAVWYGRPAGIVLSALVWIMYRLALAWEDPFTAKIYAERERKQHDDKKTE